MTKLAGINHITFATANLHNAIEFYCNLLGMDLVAQWTTGAYLLVGNMWICLSYDEDTKSTPNKDYSHIAFDIAPEHFDDFKKHIVKKNIPTWKDNTSEGKSLYILDPDFNKLEIHASTLNDRLHSMMVNPKPEMLINESFIRPLRS